MTTRTHAVLACLLIATSTAWAAKPKISGESDAINGSATRAHLNEQAEGRNRGEIEPYKAQSAGKAYKAYSDNIGTRQAPTNSQIETRRP